MPKLCLGFVQKDSRPANPTSTGDFIHTYYLSELTIDGNGKFLTLRDTDGDPLPGGSPGTGNSRSAYLKKKPCFSFPSIKDFDLVDMRFKCDASQARRSVSGDIFDAYLLGCYSADVDDPDPDDALIKTWLFRTRLHPVLGMEYVDSNENRRERQPRFWTCFAVRDKVYCLFSARYGESRPAFWCHDPATGERETLAVPEFLVGPRKCFLCGYVFVAIHGEILVCLVNMEFYSYNVKLGIWRRVAFRAECVNRNILVILERSVVAFPVVGEHPNFQLCAPVVLVDDIIPGVRMGAYGRWTKCMAHLGDLRFCVLVAIHNKGEEPNRLHAVIFRALLDGNKGHLVGS